VLGPKYDPSKPTEHQTKIQVETLFLLMGKELEELPEVPAGNIFGILGLGENVLKSATLSTTLQCPSFGQLYYIVSPIVRVAVEPAFPCSSSPSPSQKQANNHAITLFCFLFFFCFFFFFFFFFSFSFF